MKTQTSGVSSVILLAVAGLMSGPAISAEFGSGEWSGSIDTTVSYGASWRLDDYDPNDVGKAANNPTAFLLPNAVNRTTIGRWSNNGPVGTRAPGCTRPSRPSFRRLRTTGHAGHGRNTAA